jgi:hypothetical protein
MVSEGPTVLVLPDECQLLADSQQPAIVWYLSSLLERIEIVSPASSLAGSSRGLNYYHH